MTNPNDRNRRAGNLGSRITTMSVALLVCASVVSAQDPPPVFRVDVGMTRVKAAVIDDEGNPVAGLSVDDFEVFEDGELRELSLVLDPVEFSMDVALVLDFSVSVARAWSADAAREAAMNFLRSLSPDDCVYLLPFHGRVGPGIWGGPDSDELRWAIEEYPFEPLTRLYDAILVGHDALDQRRPDSASAAAEEVDAMMSTWMTPVRASSCGDPLSPDEALGRRAALVVLSDGEDFGSVSSYSDVLMASWRAEVPIFAIAVGMAANPPRYRGSGWNSNTRYMRSPSQARISRERIESLRALREQLHELARVSGGQLVTQQDLSAGYTDTLGLLRSYYVLAYPSPDPLVEGWHELEVKVAGSNRQVVVQPAIYRTEGSHVAAVSSLREASVDFELGNYEDALRQLDFVSRVSPDIGAPFFGRGLVLEKLGRWEQARDSFARSLQLRPGAPVTHSRLAVALVELGEYEAGWDHAIKAHRGGVDMTPTFARLEAVSDPPADREERLLGPVVHVLKPPVPGLEAQLAMREVSRVLLSELDSDPTIGLTAARSMADFTLRVWVRRVTDGDPPKMVARLVITDTADGRRADKPLDIADLDDPAVVGEAVASAVTSAREWILERHRGR